VHLFTDAPTNFRAGSAILPVVFYPETFGYAEKLEWTALVLFLAIIGPVIIVRTLATIYPREQRTAARLQRAFTEGLLAQWRSNVSVVWFGIGCVAMAVLAALFVLVPAWSAR
jgi:hypothetical protein